MEENMKRWHEEINIAKRNQKVRCKLVNSDDVPLGRYRKRDAYDCGKTQCGLCHNDKFPKRELTRKENLAKFNYKEQLKELD